MKRISFCATVFFLLVGLASVASAAKFTTAAGETTVLGGVVFSPSTGVGLDAIATTTDWAAAAKHESGGTTMYGMTSADTNISLKPDLDKADKVVNQDSPTSLKGFN